MSSTYDKLFDLFVTRTKGNCYQKQTRKLLSPVLQFFNMFEQERCADVRQDFFQHALEGNQFQWFYWTVDDHYAGMGEWREFTPVSIVQLNKAIREKKTSVRLTVSQRTYLIDFNEMTKRLLPDQQQQQQGFHPLHSSVPIYAKANLRDDFDIEQFVKLDNELRNGTERHQQIVKGILNIIKSSSIEPLDNELAHNALTLLLRLVSLNGIAQVFLKEDGIKALLQLKRNTTPAQLVANGTTPPTLNTLATLILRQCIDSDNAVLQTVFEQMIKATCNGQPISMQEITSRRHAMRVKRYQKDVKRVLRTLVPLAVRSPALCIDLAKNNMIIKKNEILLKESHDDSTKGGTAATISDQSLQMALNQIITELVQFDALKDSDKNFRLLQSSNLLKLIAEILRSYPTMAVAFFVEKRLDNQQHSVLRWVIDHFLLSAPVNDLSDNVHWAKTVVSELISNSPSQRITDFVIGDIQALLVASDGLDYSTSTPPEKNNASAKFADRVTILAKLTMHLRECLQMNNAQNNAKQNGFIVKGIHKKNLANDFVRSIWKIPLYEKQGIETVNAILKLFEGVLTKNGGNFEAMNPRSFFVPAFSYDARSFQYYDDEDLDLGRSALEEIGRTSANIDPLVSSTPREQTTQQNESTSGPIEREETVQEEDESVVEPEHIREEMLENILDTTQEGNEEGGASEDESPHDSEEENMDTGEELVPHGHPGVHEGAMEDDHISEAVDANEPAMQSYFAADNDLEEMDDDDDGEEDEEEETEVEGGGEIADFEDTLLDYITDFSALAQQMQDIRRRINLNIDTNAIRPQELQQVFGQRALVGYHPRNGGAVLRIRAGPHANLARNFLDLERLATTAFNAGQVGGLQNGAALNQLFSTLAGYGQVGPRESSPEDRTLPCFVDRVAEWGRLVEGKSMFVTGAIVTSHLIAAMEVPPETTTAAENQKDKATTEEKPASTQEETGQAEPMDHNPEQEEDENRTDQMEALNPPPTASVPTSQEYSQRAEGQGTDAGANLQQSNAPILEGVDSAFLAALPEDMRQEVIRDHLLQQQFNQTDNTTARTNNDTLPTERIAAIMGMEIPEGMDPEFLAALPEDIFHEVVRDHQRQQEMARQRQAQQSDLQPAQELIRQTHHRHFSMPRFLARNIRPTHTNRDLPTSSSSSSSTERSLQFLDRESISTLLILYLLDQEKFDIARLQKLLKLVCAHPGTCDFTIWALLSMFDGLDKFRSLEGSDAYEGGKFNSGWVNELRVQNVLNRHERILMLTPSSFYINNQIRTIAAQRIIDNLAYLARSFARNFMPKQIRTSIGKQESPPPMPSYFWNIIRNINGRTVDNSLKESSIKLMHEMIADTTEKSPLAQLFKLLDSSLAKENRAITDRIIRMISSLSHAIPSDFQEKISEETKIWLGNRLKEFTNALMSSCTDEALREGRLLLAEMFRAVPSECQSILHAIYQSIKDHGTLLRRQLSSMRQTTEGEGQQSQSLLNVLKEVSGRDSIPSKLLKSLETLQYLYNQLKKLEEQKKKAEINKKKSDAEKKETAEVQQQTSDTQNEAPEKQMDETTLIRNMVDELTPLWDELSNCLSLLEKVEDSQHAVLCLQNAAEAFFLSYSLVIPQNSQLPSTFTADRLITAGSSPPFNSSAGATPGDEMNRYQNEMFTFAERHRSVLNQILRGNTQNLEGSAFTILTHFPKLLDFDVKRKYFYKELKKMDERNRYRHEDIAIRVRRSHLFGDSFRELYRLRPNDWKARLYIIFEGEEGQDAGGLLREWYAVITREIFNPNYALFITAPGDRVTYMINKSSYVNPEHLDYFRFVGRIIAKAIYDNKQLDCYFTRAFYKHILNKHVRYQDIESEDPDLFKSLEFLLNNAVEDLGAELPFSVEVEEFGERSTRELKENGLHITVTDANKDEYVHLICQMKMTGSIRQQLNAFLEGFYEVIPKKLISIFNEQELELLISGLPNIDIDDLCANTEYKTYTRTSPQIQWFWRALKSFDAEDKAKFLQFVTGTSKVPLQGFAHLEGMNGVQKFTIQKDTRSSNRLPTAHTCFNQLDLPEYPDYETLQKMLLLAFRECSEGFAFA